MATATAAKTTTTPRKAYNVTNRPEQRAVIERIKVLKEAERAGAAAARERKELEAALRVDMGDAEQVVLRGVVIAKLSSLRTTHHYDYDVLRETFPEAYTAVHSESHYKFLTVL